MSSFSPEASSLGPERRSVLELERCQGFNFRNGLSRTSKRLRKRPGPIEDLYQGVISLKGGGLGFDERQDESSDLFDLLGPALWSMDVSKAWWLSKQKDYPQNLCYEDKNDREKYVSCNSIHSCSRLRQCRLRGYFLEMIEQKCINHESYRMSQGGNGCRDASDNVVPSRSSRALSNVRTFEDDRSLCS